jgi:hypothetical protein
MAPGRYASVLLQTSLLLSLSAISRFSNYDTIKYRLFESDPRRPIRRRDKAGRIPLPHFREMVLQEIHRGKYLCKSRSATLKVLGICEVRLQDSDDLSEYYPVLTAKNVFGGDPFFFLGIKKTKLAKDIDNVTKSERTMDHQIDRIPSRIIICLDHQAFESVVDEPYSQFGHD